MPNPPKAALFLFLSCQHYKSELARRGDNTWAFRVAMCCKLCVRSCSAAGSSTGFGGPSFSQPSGANRRVDIAWELFLLLVQIRPAERLWGRWMVLVLLQKGCFHGNTGQGWKLTGPGSHVSWTLFVRHTPEEITAVNSALNITDITGGVGRKGPHWTF